LYQEGNDYFTACRLASVNSVTATGGSMLHLTDRLMAVLHEPNELPTLWPHKNHQSFNVSLDQQNRQNAHQL